MKMGLLGGYLMFCPSFRHFYYISLRFDVENEREHRRRMQQVRRAKEDQDTRDVRHKNDGSARQLARRALNEPRQAQIRQADAEAHRAPLHSQNTTWWVRVAVPNRCEILEALGLHLNKKCKKCNIQVRQAFSPIQTEFTILFRV
jgi:hypothetical protein